MENQGMKKFLPFASLTEHEVYIKEMLKKRSYISKPQISLEQANKINRILNNYKNDELDMKIYINGKIYNYHGIISLNLIKKSFFIKHYQIPIKNIIDIETTEDLMETF